MRLPAFLVVLWPIAAFAGGKLFAPLLFVLGLLLGWRQLVGLPRREGLAFGVFLVWVCVTSLWSPADVSLTSGSLLNGNFAIEAAHVRFALSALGVCLFLALIVSLPAGAVTELPKVFPVAIVLQLCVLLVLAGLREELLIVDSSQIFVPSAQSLGRNTNLLALVLPIAIGVWVDRYSRPVAALLVIGLSVAGVWVLLAHDALAGLLGWAAAGVIGMMLFAMGRSGFRWVFNLMAFAIIATPIVFRILLGFVSPQTVALPLSAEQRLVIWQTALEKIAAKPVFGHGINAVNVWDETYASRPDLLAMLDARLIDTPLIPNHTHNMALQVWAETGGIGAVLLALVFVLLGRAMPMPSRLTHGTRIAVAGVIGGAGALFAVAYSAWDESFWASLAVISSALIVMARQSPQMAT